MNRRNFLDKRLDYLFSFDLDLARSRGRPGNTCPAVITSQAHDFGQLADAQKPPIYNALGDARVLAEEAIAGRVEFAQDTIRYLPDSDFAEIRGRVVLKTNDEQTIQGEYEGVARAGRSWLAVRSSFGEQSAPAGVRDEIETKANVRLRFETGSTKYQWLVKYQCVGYGKLGLRGGEPSSATFDIYALNQPF
jgi:hypothetical protein